MTQTPTCLPSIGKQLCLSHVFIRRENSHKKRNQLHYQTMVSAALVAATDHMMPENNAPILPRHLPLMHGKHSMHQNEL